MFIVEYARKLFGQDNQLLSKSGIILNTENGCSEQEIIRKDLKKTYEKKQDNLKHHYGQGYTFLCQKALKVIMNFLAKILFNNLIRSLLEENEKY